MRNKANVHFLSQEKYDIKIVFDKLDILVHNIFFSIFNNTKYHSQNIKKVLSDEVIKPMLKGRVEGKVF